MSATASQLVKNKKIKYKCRYKYIERLAGRIQCDKILEESG